MSSIESNKPKIDCDLISKIDQSEVWDNKNKETKELLLEDKKNNRKKVK